MDILAFFEKIDFAALWKQIEAITGPISVDQLVAFFKTIYTFIAGLF